MAQHSIFELRTSRHAEHTPETAVQLFATLPEYKHQWWFKLLNQDEHLSFEIILQNQTIFFLAYLPDRLAEYIKGLISASYPEVLVTQLQHDPLTTIWPTVDETMIHRSQVSNQVEVASLQLKNAEYFPIKTYHDFKDIDPLSPLIATLSKAQDDDLVVIQYVVAPADEKWKNAGRSQIQPSGEGGSHPQQDLIKRKLDGRGTQIAIKLVVATPQKERSKLMIENIASALQSISQSDGNTLELKRFHLFPQQFIRSIKTRSFTGGPSFHLTLDELATLYHLPSKKLSHIPNIAWGKQLLGEPPEELPVVTRDSGPEIKENTNVYAKTIYKNKDSVFGIKRYDRRKHMYVIGKTGTGKSTLLANMAINDLKNDEGVCVIDPHGDLVETLLDYIPARRTNDVLYFNPADTERTVQLNLFEGESVAHRELIASGIVSVFQKLYGYSWGPRLEYILRNSLLTLLTMENSRLSDVVLLLTDKYFRSDVVNQLEDQILRNFWLNEFNQMQPRQQTEAIAPILNKVGQFVASPLVRDVVNAHKSSFSIEEFMNEGKIMFFNLSQGRLGEDNATLLGAMLITKIQLAAMARVGIPEEERRDFYLYVDEFQNFATQSFNKILSEARKYRLNLVLANQYIAQIPEDVQKAIFGNCGSMASFIMGADDARVFASEYGGQYTEEDLVSLSRYQIINKLSIDNVTSKPFPATTLPLATSRNNNRDKVIRVSRERYAKRK